jgi:hypothetical protein
MSASGAVCSFFAGVSCAAHREFWKNIQRVSLMVSSGAVWTRMTDGTSIVRDLGLDLTELPYQHCA